MKRASLVVTADEALRRLRNVSPIIYRSLEAGTEKARDFFESRELQVEPFLFSTMVRYFAWLMLTSEKYQDVGLKVEKLTNVGIQLKCEGFLIRIWKTGEEGELPPPGESMARQAFYNQQQPFLPFDYSDIEEFAPVKLAFVWNAGSDHTLSEVYLVCPSADEGPWRPGMYHWNARIEHPAESIQADVSLVDEVEFDDLELALASTSDSSHD